MTPIQRIEKELKLRKLTWVAFGAALDASKQSVTNWKTDGLPKKHYSKVDEFFGKPYGWTELGIEQVQNGAEFLSSQPERLKVILGTVAGMFRLIPEDQWGDALLDISTALQKRQHFE